MTIKIGSFPSLLAVALIVLKLTRVIEWSWLAVLSPIWGPFAVATGFLLFAAILSAFISKG